MFIFNIQIPTDNFDQSNDIGSINFESFVKEFEKFDWIGNINLANQIQKVSPTLSVKNDSDKSVLWVSAYLNDNVLEYIIGFVRKVEKTFLGIWNREVDEHRQMETKDLIEVENLFSSYFRGEYEDLFNVLK